MSKLEKDLQYKILNYIRSNYHGSVAFKVERCSVNSVPDIYATIPNYGSVWIETKRDANSKFQPGQLSMIKRLSIGGTPSYAIHSWDKWMELKKEIDMTIKGELDD